MFKEYCYILDYSDATICEIELTDEDKDLESEDLLNKYGCKSDTCSFMFTAVRIENITKLN